MNKREWEIKVAVVCFSLIFHRACLVSVALYKLSRVRPEPSPKEQQVNHCSKLLLRTVPAAFPSPSRQAFWSGAFQTRERKAPMAACHRTLGRRGEYN